MKSKDEELRKNQESFDKASEEAKEHVEKTFKIIRKITERKMEQKKMEQKKMEQKEMNKGGEASLVFIIIVILCLGLVVCLKLDAAEKELAKFRKEGLERGVLVYTPNNNGKPVLVWVEEQNSTK